MKNLVLGILFALCSVNTSAGYLVLNTDGTAAIGIRNLDVAGTTYNVDFVFTKFSELSPDQFALWGDDDATQAAAFAINPVLGSYEMDSYRDEEYYMLPYSYSLSTTEWVNTLQSSLSGYADPKWSVGGVAGVALRA